MLKITSVQQLENFFDKKVDAYVFEEDAEITFGVDTSKDIICNKLKGLSVKARSLAGNEVEMSHHIFVNQLNLKKVVCDQIEAQEADIRECKCNELRGRHIKTRNAVVRQQTKVRVLDIVGLYQILDHTA